MGISKMVSGNRIGEIDLSFDGGVQVPANLGTRHRLFLITLTFFFRPWVDGYPCPRQHLKEGLDLEKLKQFTPS